jgi:hypothetical protein
LLHITSGNALQIIENSAATSNASLQLKYPSRTWSIANRGADLSGSLTFRDITAGADRVVIDSSGRVGIGTTSPNQDLTISSGADKLHLFGSTAGNGGSLFATNSGYTDYEPISFTGEHIGFSTRTGTLTSSERLRITSAGLVGIGTSAPQAELNVAKTGGASTVYIESDVSNNATTSILRFGGASGRSASIQGFRGASSNIHSLDFYTYNSGDSFGMRLTSTGLGIGTTSPSAPLHINGTANNTAITLSVAGTVTGYIGPAGFLGGSDSSLGYRAETGNNHAFFIGASEKVRIDSSGRLGIGTSSPEPGAKLTVAGGIFATSFITASATNAGAIDFVNDGRGTRILSYGPDGSTKTAISFAQGVAGGSATEAMRIDSSGRVGIGTTSPGDYDAGGNKLVIADTTNSGITIRGGTSGQGAIYFADGTTGNEAYRGRIEYSHSNDSLNFGTAGTGFRVTLDSSGRLLVGTSSTSRNRTVVLQGDPTGANNAGALNLQANTTPGGAGTSIGLIDAGNTAGIGASIEFRSDAAWGAGDYPGRIEFSTTADGASSPTERMRIRSDGTTLIGKTTGDDTVTGVKLGTNAGDNVFTVGSGASWALMCNRQGDDGTLILFRQANSAEGSISVSGTTVSYNGAHLSRWSQLPSGADRTEILRGSVLSNIDEMCEWGDEENEQLNRMKVSDVEGDKNVSGVFQAWDDDDDTYINDFYCAMTGDFIIRIGAGTTVERGDLLMSAGDGTAKPQDDDIIRSKTIAKVTSTNVNCTYDDGSYCVPCVLMAC